MKFFLKTAVFVLFFAGFSFKTEAQSVFGESWYKGGDYQPIEEIRLSPKGDILAVGMIDHLELIKTENGKVLKSFPFANTPVWTEEGNLLIILSDSLRSDSLRIIDTTTGKIIKTIAAATGDLKFSPSKKYLFAGKEAFKTDVWQKIDLTNFKGDFLTVMSGDTTALTLFNAVNDTVFLSRFPSGEIIGAFPLPESSTNYNAFGVNNGSTFFVVLSYNCLYFIDLLNGKLIQKLNDPPPSSQLNRKEIFFSPDDKYALILNSIMDLSDYSARYYSSSDIEPSLDWSEFYTVEQPSRQYVCTSDEMPRNTTSVLKRRDRNGRILWRLKEGHDRKLQSIDFDINTNRIFTTSADSVQIHWGSKGEIIDLKYVAALPEIDSSNNLSPLGKYRIERAGFADGSSKGWRSLEIYDNSTDSLLFTIYDSGFPYGSNLIFKAWAWMPNEKYLLTASKPYPWNGVEYKILKMWDIELGKVIASIPIPCYPTLIKVSPDGKSIALATEEFGIMYIKTIGDFATSVLKEDVAELSLNFYPNPLKESSVISCSLPSDGVLKIMLYDMFGREVSILNDSFKSAGNYTLPFKAENLPDGMYFLKMSAGGQTLTKSVSILR